VTILAVVGKKEKALVAEILPECSNKRPLLHLTKQASLDFLR